MKQITSPSSVHPNANAVFHMSKAIHLSDLARAKGACHVFRESVEHCNPSFDKAYWDWRTGL
jgi:hypothetical protein